MSIAVTFEVYGRNADDLRGLADQRLAQFFGDRPYSVSWFSVAERQWNGDLSSVFSPWVATVTAHELEFFETPQNEGATVGKRKGRRK